MKKLDDKMLNKGTEEEIANDRTDDITCDCCNLPSATPVTEAGEGEKEEYEQANLILKENKEQRKSSKTARNQDNRNSA